MSAPEQVGLSRKLLSSWEDPSPGFSPPSAGGEALILAGKMRRVVVGEGPRGAVGKLTTCPSCVNICVGGEGPTGGKAQLKNDGVFLSSLS